MPVLCKNSCGGLTRSWVENFGLSFQNKKVVCYFSWAFQSDRWDILVVEVFLDFRWGKQVLFSITNFISRAWAADETIELVGRVGFEDDPTSFFRQFERLFRPQNKPGKRAVVDLTKAEFVYPSALIFLLCLAETLKPNVELHIRVSEKSKLHEYLLNCGFSDVFQIPSLPANFRPLVEPGKVIRLETGTDIPNTEERARWFVDLIDGVDSMELYFRDRAEESIGEILRNVKQHSGCSKFYMLGQSFATSRNVRLITYDDGVGILPHLTRMPYNKQHPQFRKLISKSDYHKMHRLPANFTIEKAAIYNVSATNYIENSGAGLDFLVNDFSGPLNGTVTIISGDGFVQWKNGQRQHSIALPFKIKGTLVAIGSKGLAV